MVEAASRIVRTSANAEAPLRVMLLTCESGDGSVAAALDAAHARLEVHTVDGPQAARSALRLGEWSLAIVECSHTEASATLDELPASLPRVLVADRLDDAALSEAQRHGAVLCMSTQLDAQLERVLQHVSAPGGLLRREEFDAEQIRILERVATGVPLHEVLDRIVLMIESSGRALCSILLLDPVTQTVRHGAAPSLPRAFIEAIDGRRIGPTAGSCGAAAYTRKSVFVRDIATHPNWQEYRSVALPQGLRACWSTPIFSPDGEVLGTFANYYRYPCDPTPDELRQVASATHLAAVAIMRDRQQRALERSELRYRQILETSREGVLALDLDGCVSFANQRAASMLGYAPDELRGVEMRVLAHPSEHEHVDEVLARRRAGMSEQYELHCVTRDGEDVWTIVAASPISDEKGQVAGCLKMLTDITERRKAEQALARSELELRTFFETTGMGVALLDSESRPVRFNAALTRILGYSEDELRRIPLTELVHPEDRERVRLAREALDQREASNQELEVRAIRRDGRTIWVRAHSTRFAQPTSRALVGVIVVTDITEEKRLEDEYSAEQRLLALIYDSVTEVICYLKVEPDETYRFVSINTAFSRLFGVGLHEVVGKTLDEVLPMVPLDSVKRHYREAIEGRRTVRWDEVGHLASGTESVEAAATPVFDASGTCTNLIVTSRLSTERKRAEAKIAEQAALLDRARDAIIVRSLDGVVRYWNASAARLYGYTASEAIGRSMAELLCRDPEELADPEKETIEHGAFGGELSLVGSDGGDVVFDASWTLLRDADGKPESVLCIHTDASERKKLEAKVMLAQRMESLGTLAGGIAHDFNNILAAISGYLELAMRGLPRSSAAWDSLVVVRTATDRAIELVQQILTFSRRKPAQREELELRPVVEEVLRLLRASLPRMIRIEAEYAGEELTVLADATQIHQILMNLGTNAAHAIDSHGTIRVTLEPIVIQERLIGIASEGPPGPYMRLRVSDDGRGMDRETLGRIFDPFYTTKAPGVGTGLGLSVVLGIVKEHGGVLRVQSKPGEGTTFEVYLPEASRPRRTSAPPKAPAADLRGHHERILCVDDEGMLLALEQTFLSDLNYRVDAFLDPHEALAAFRAEPGDYAAVVTDLAMPGMSGIELAEVVHRTRPELPIVLCSGHLRAEQRAQALSVGVCSLVLKPDILEPLARELARLVRKPPARA